MEFDLNCLNTTTSIGILSLILSSYLFLFRSSKSRDASAKGREPPIAGGAWPILGHLPLLRGNYTPHRTLGAIADKYGPLVTIKLGTKRALLLSNWEMAKECFTKNDTVVSSRPKLVAVEKLAYNQAMLGFAPYGPYWREMRKIATLEFLSNRRIELLSHVRASEVEKSIKELFNFWSNRKNENGYVLVEVDKWFSYLATNMTLRMAIGKRYFNFGGVNDKEGERSLKVFRDFMHLMGAFQAADAVPVLRWFDFGGYVKAMKKTFKELDGILSEWLEEHRQKHKLGPQNVEKDQDFMDVLLSVIEKKPMDGFDADTINKATTLSLVLGGIDTISETITWVISLLLNNPHTLKKAKEELDTQIGREGHITESDIDKLVYLQAIVKETFRLYTPSSLSAPREFTEDCTLGGYKVKKGTRLITNLWRIQTDPSVWSDPLDFKPERFLTTHKEVDVKGHHFELIPFGGGRRICPGMNLSLHMVYLSLASFLYSFDILNPSSEPIDMTEKYALTNHKATPLEILVKPCFSPKYYQTM